MKVVARSLMVVLCAALGAAGAHAQTADEVIEKHLAAIGGRAALTKLQSRIATGSIAVSAQGADLTGTIEIYSKAPNKTRSYFKLDMSQFGAPDMVVDQRCDGRTAFASNSMQGDRDITGNQLQNMLNATFPTPLLTYKEAGTKAELVGKDKVGTRDVYVVLTTPKAGSPSKGYFDAETYLLLRTVVRVDIPEMGGETEQTTDLSDYRETDGVKVPFTLKIVSSMQTVAIVFANVEHNKPIDDAMFSKPAAAAK
jgi:outer membrane lipoprotein-sorting protein